VYRRDYYEISTNTSIHKCRYSTTDRQYTNVGTAQLTDRKKTQSELNVSVNITHKQ